MSNWTKEEIERLESIGFTLNTVSDEMEKSGDYENCYAPDLIEKNVFGDGTTSYELIQWVRWTGRDRYDYRYETELIEFSSIESLCLHYQ